MSSGQQGMNPGMRGPQPPPPEKKSGAMKACLIIGGVLGCVGIGVIGLLALIAVPNFMKFQCKSKQSEAKTNLSGLFTAEKAFYGEYNSYTSDLVALNWYPYAGENGPTYLYGFAYGGPDENIPGMGSNYDIDRADSLHPDVVSAGSYKTGKMITSSGRPLSSDDLPEESEVSKDAFIAAAVGNVDGDSDLDIWTINEVKMLMPVQDDCR